MAEQHVSGDLGRASMRRADPRRADAGNFDRARAPVDRSRASQRGGSIGLVLLIAIVLIGAGAGLIAVGRAHAEPYVLALLAVLAMVGVFLMLALAAGVLRAAGKDSASPLLKSVGG